ncbi:TetR/AcrR family transcriptional regulator [Oceanobacillus sp. 1P07AA]|uniref:TetR/AcrR family transcriptional regulator n=1 Tax=Oceanobacillus sp. 1P07AA TaxID=3132293 RepID=UPI0039A6A4C8
MPKVTFFNLPDEKRNKLMEAAEKEFSRVPLSQASISNIVKSACVARGSFYQYFENKEDAFYYLLKLQTEKRRGYFFSTLEENDGDIFIAIERLFQMLLADLSNEDNLKFLQNALMNVTHEIEDSFTGLFIGQKPVGGTIEGSIDRISGLIDSSKLNITGDQEFFHVMQILTSVTFRNLVDKFSRNLSNEEAKENFRIEMELLRKGLYKS